MNCCICEPSFTWVVFGEAHVVWDAVRSLLLLHPQVFVHQFLAPAFRVSVVLVARDVADEGRHRLDVTSNDLIKVLKFLQRNGRGKIH